MSYSDSFPTQRPSLNLVFNGGSDQLDSRISFSRSDTPPTYAAPSAVHYWSNQKHLSSENLLPYSNNLSVWTSTTTTTPSTNNLAPDGTNTATAVIENTATSGHNRYTSFSSVSGTNYTFLTFAKANGRTQFQVVAQATTTIANVKFDLTAVTSTVTSGSAVSHNITAIGSAGWYKCEVTVTATGTGSNAYHQVNLLDATGSNTYTGDGVSGLYLWGCQVSSLGEQILNSTSGSIHREYSSTLKSVANAGDPRFEYDPITNNAEGLLIEAQATNLQRYGSAFASWSSEYNVSVKSDAAVAPNGKLEADLVTATSTPGGHYVYDNGATLASGTDYTASVYVKNAGQRYVQLVGSASNFGGSKWATFDLVDGSIDATNVTASAESVGNGWWRIQGTMAATGSTQGNIFVALADSATAARSPSFTGDDYSGVLLFGYQLEAAASASSLVDTGTSSSSATRAADSCSVAVSDFAGFADTEGAVVVEATVNSLDSSNATAVSFSNAAGTEFIKTGYQVGGVTDQSVRAYVRGSSADQAYIDAGSVSATGSYKVGVRYEKNNVGASLNGASVVTDTVAIMPIGMNTLYIGSSASGTYPMNANLKRITYYSEPLSDTNLTALTS